jgi:hypothetical protein
MLKDLNPKNIKSIWLLVKMNRYMEACVAQCLETDALFLSTF